MYHKHGLTSRHSLASRISLVDFPEADKVFEEVVKENPHRLDSLDVFSNVLFTTGKRARLSFLAHSCAMTDNYRPETCCVIGNLTWIMLSGEGRLTLLA